MCLTYLEKSGERAVPVIAEVSVGKSGLRELKVGLLVVLGNSSARIVRNPG